MKIKIICFGKIKDNSLKEMILLFTKRISYFCEIETIELNEAKITNENSESEIKVALDKEYQMLLKHLKDKNCNILLDLQGKKIDSIKFAQILDENIKKFKLINFIIGSSYGFDNKVKTLCHYQISFSDLTFNHQIFRLMLLEQIYRGFTIANNIKYHK